MKNEILKRTGKIIFISVLIAFATMLKFREITKAAMESFGIHPIKYTIEEKKEKTLEYMKEKYGEEFVGLRWSGEDLFQSYDKFVVYPKSKGEQYEARVEWVYNYKKKDYDIYDSYIWILIKDKYTDYVTKFLRTKYPTAYITSIDVDSNRAYTSKLTVDTPINKIADIELRSEKMVVFHPSIDIVVSYRDLDNGNLIKFYEDISKLFLKNNLAVSLFILVCKDEMFEDYISKNGKIYPNDYYDEEIAKKYFVKTDKVDTYHYEMNINIWNNDYFRILESDFEYEK